jgi:hypothetical protein
MIIKQTVIPRKISRASERLDETGVDTFISNSLKRGIYRKYQNATKYFIRFAVIERATITL